MSTPHLMFYAPQLSNEEIGAILNASIPYPFIFKEGIAEQSYMIQLIGEAEEQRSSRTKSLFSMRAVRLSRGSLPSNDEALTKPQPNLTRIERDFHNYCVATS